MFEIATTKSNEPVGHTGGYIIPNIEMHINANPIMKAGGKPLESVQILNSLLSQVLNVKGKKFLPENCFSIAGAENNYCLICFIDVAVLCDDGGILDLAMLSISKLFNANGGVEIPVMKYDRSLGQLYSTNSYQKIQICTQFLPLSLTFSIFQGIDSDDNTEKSGSFLFLDPTYEETLLSNNNQLTIFGTVCGEILMVEQMGQGLDQEQYFEAVKIAKEHFVEVGQKFLGIE